MIMRFFKYLIGLWTAIAVYSLFSFLSGPTGISAYNQLLAEQERHLDNLDELGVVNDELIKTKNQLLDDQDTLMAYARQLGYGRQDDRYVRIVGLGAIKNPHNTAGKVYYTAAVDFLSDKIIKIASLCAGLLVFAIFFVYELIEPKYGHNKSV